MIENEMTVSVPLEVVKASEIEPKEVKWLWYPYIPFGKVTLLQGDPGDGKSKLMLSVVALLSKGEPLPFTETEENEPKLCAVIDNILLNEKPASFEGFLQKLEQQGYEIKRGKYTSVKGTRQKRFIRFRILGAGYSEDEIKAVIAGEAEHRLDFIFAVPCTQCPKTDKAFLPGAFDGGVLSSLDFIALLFQLLKKGFKVCGLLVQQDVVDYGAQLIPIAFSGWIKGALLPLPVWLDFNDGELMLQTNQIAQSLHRKPR